MAFSHLLLIGLLSIFQPISSDSGTGSKESSDEYSVGTDLPGVVVEYKQIYSPVEIPWAVPPIPPAPSKCDFISYFRISQKHNGAIKKAPDLYLLLLPGIIVGNNSFLYIGKHLVDMAKKHTGLNLEIWAMDRRANCLEDLTGLNAAEKARNTNIAVDYYYFGAEIDHKTFDKFLSNSSKRDEIGFLSEFGLPQVLNDAYKLITTNIPNQHVRRNKLFLGAHSLSGFIIAAFLGWDFNGDPGYRNCAGVIGLDTLITPFFDFFNPLLQSLLPESIKSLLRGILDIGGYKIAVAGLQLGFLPRILPTDKLVGMDGETFAVTEMLAMEANFNPTDEATLLKRIPYGDNVRKVLKFVQSKDVFDSLSKEPKSMKLRFTNEALLGTLFDDNFMPVTIQQASMGFLAGGKIARKDFPIPRLFSNLSNQVVNYIGILLTFSPLYIPDEFDANSNSGPLYTWINYDKVTRDDYTRNITNPEDLSDFGDPVEEEVTDLHDFALAFYQGKSNLVEWYMPTRVLLDMLMICKTDAYTAILNGNLRFKYPNEIDNTHKIEFITEKGPFLSMAKDIRKDDFESLKGYDHADVWLASVDNKNRENEVFMPIIEFMIEHLNQYY